MSVLALRLAGPLQSWGSSARFARRTTESAPTKSAVIGMFASALGLERGDDAGLARLGALRFGVRIDQPGTRVRDFQTARHFDSNKSMPLSERFYLADAVFVAVVEGDTAVIGELDGALKTPVYLPYLGRRSCPPTLPLELGLHHEVHLEQVLRDEPWRAAPWFQRLRRRDERVSLAVLTEAAEGEQGGDVLRDQPLSFSAEHRRHALRSVISTTVDVPNPLAFSRSRRVPPHDPFGSLEEAAR